MNYCICIFYRSHVSFGVDGPHQMQQQAHLHVVAKNLYSQDAARTPVPFGVLDRRMVGLKNGICGTINAVHRTKDYPLKYSSYLI